MVVTWPTVCLFNAKKYVQQGNHDALIVAICAALLSIWFLVRLYRKIRDTRLKK
jgi:hypothetical protein